MEHDLKTMDGIDPGQSVSKLFLYNFCSNFETSFTSPCHHVGIYHFWRISWHIRFSNENNGVLNLNLRFIGIPTWRLVGFRNSNKSYIIWFTDEISTDGLSTDRSSTDGLSGHARYIYYILYHNLNFFDFKIC